jgi:cell division protein YceG involved in septum cleavage
MYSLSPSIRRFGFWLFVALGFSLFAFVASFYIWTKSIVKTAAEPTFTAVTTEEAVVLNTTELLFPVGVNPEQKNITENPAVDEYVETYLSFNINKPRDSDYLNRFLAIVTQFDWYQNLASAVSRILVIYPGERHEEIESNFAKILKWDTTQKNQFSEYIKEAEPVLLEGKFYPGKYVVPVDATPEQVADLLYEKFTEEVLNRYSEDMKAVVPLSDALIIASLLEREAYDFTDMRYISGVIWNRLFIDMPLQLDASLQYVRGAKLSEKSWWPKPVPADKYLKSPYNTYQNAGLPPAPIANPSVAAIVAALNPRITDCMFYFHGPKGQFYCTNTYDEHVAKLREVYGRGK